MTAVPPPAPPAAPARPRPVNGLGTAAAALLAATALLTVPMFTDSWSDYLVLSDHVNGRLGEDAFWDQYLGRYTSYFTLMALAAPVFLATGITWLLWIHRARTNAAILSPHHHFRYSPGFSVGGMVVPFANLWWSRPILEDIGRGSSPYGPADDVVRLVRSWWAIVVTGTAVSIVGQVLVPIPTLSYSADGALVAGGTDALGAWFATALLNTLLMVMAVASFVVLAVIIRRVSRQQTALLFPAQPA